MPAAKKTPVLTEQLRKELPRLLREDVEFRGQVIALLGDYLTTREETAAILAELRQMRADFDLRMDEQGRRIEAVEARIEEHGRTIQEHTQALSRQTEDIRALQRTVVGLGARWGLLAEEAFRSGIQAMFAHQPEVEVARWLRRDTEGEVFGYAADVELDVVVRDGVHLVAQIKSSISTADVLFFERKVKFYERTTGHAATRRLMIGPFGEERAREAAEHFSIEISAGVSAPSV